MKVVFLSHPFQNDPLYLKHVTAYAEKIWAEGDVPVVPHYLFPMVADESTERDKIMQGCFELIHKADQLVVCGLIISEGMRLEVDEAERIGKETRWVVLNDQY